MGALRAARAEHTRSRRRLPGDDDPQSTVVSSWRLLGHGHTPGQALIAGDIARDLAANRTAARTASPATDGGEHA
jgi:hypothetical protein